jgi:hypothetical protein
MRLKAGLWVEAFMRRAQQSGLAVYVQARGDPDAGEILIKFDRLDGLFDLLAPAIGSAHRPDGSRIWRRLPADDPAREHDIDRLVEQREKIDPDLWLITVEARNGWAGLDDDIAAGT